MTMFKKGDRVVRTGPSMDGNKMTRGETYTVRRMDGSALYVEGSQFPYTARAFKPAPPEFKPGDIVDAHRDEWEEGGGWEWAKGLSVVRVLAGNVWTADYPGGPTTRSFSSSALTHTFKPNKADVSNGDTVTLRGVVEGSPDRPVVRLAPGSTELLERTPKPKPFGYGTAYASGSTRKGFVTSTGFFRYLDLSTGSERVASPGEFFGFRPDE